MTRYDLLILQLAEECAEVQQRAIKLLRFGAEQGQSTEPAHLGGAPLGVGLGSNMERLQAEINDLCSLIQICGYRYPTREETDAKRVKVEKYLEYSRELGRVTD